LLLDTAYNIGTPEGVELRLPVAGLASRSLAWLIDAFIKFALLMVFSIVLQFLGDFGAGVTLILMFVSLWFYNVLFEVFSHGSTPGKKALGLRVMNANGTPVGWTGSLLRNLIRFVDTLPGCYAFGCISVLLSRQFQRLRHDVDQRRSVVSDGLAQHASVPRMVHAAGGRIWSPYHGDLDAAQLEEARALGLKVIVWTVNEPTHIAAMLDLGVDGIISDYPDRVRAELQRRGMALPAATPVEPAAAGAR